MLFSIQAYSQGRYYPNYEWLLLNFCPDQWWMEYEEYLDQINCSLSSVTTVLNRALVLLPYPNNMGRSVNIFCYLYIYSIYTVQILPDRLFQTIDYLQDAITLYTTALDTSLSYHNISQDELYCQYNFYRRSRIESFIMGTSFIGKTVCNIDSMSLFRGMWK